MLSWGDTVRVRESLVNVASGVAGEVWAALSGGSEGPESHGRAVHCFSARTKQLWEEAEV